jgi:two-component system chemotaxis response regulator CheB
MPCRDIITIGASAGGVETLKELTRHLPAGLPATLFVVLHVSPYSTSMLPSILSKDCPLPVQTAEDKARIKRGHVYVAPPDHHLLVEPTQVRVVRGPKENRHRPAIDPLFRSAAWVFGPRVAGVVLSGMLDGGAAGLWAAKTCGGLAVVQDPRDALYPDMPANAMRTIEVDYCLPLAEIPPLLVRLAQEPPDNGQTPAVPEKSKLETEFVTMDHDIEDMKKRGAPSAFTCPTCHGALWELQDGDLLRYRCHIGHAFSADSLLAEQSESMENSLEQALRATEEKAATLRRLAERFAGKSHRLEQYYHSQAGKLEKHIAVLQRILTNWKP